jgi:hypothetical protein
MIEIFDFGKENVIVDLVTYIAGKKRNRSFEVLV